MRVFFTVAEGVMLSLGELKSHLNSVPVSRWISESVIQWLTHWFWPRIEMGPNNKLVGFSWNVFIRQGAAAMCSSPSNVPSSFSLLLKNTWGVDSIIHCNNMTAETPISLGEWQRQRRRQLSKRMRHWESGSMRWWQRQQTADAEDSG